MRTSQSIRTWALASTFAIAELVTGAACDSGGNDPAAGETGVSEPAAQVEGGGDFASERGAHADHHRGHMAKRAERHIDELCGVVECTDDQREAFRQQAGAKADAFAARHSDMKEARTELAAAFRGDGFAGADVQAFIQAKRDQHHGPGDMAIERAETLHRVLTPEQRATLADAMESGELGHGRGRRGHHKRRGPDAGGDDVKDHHEARAGKRAAKMLDRLCSHLECSDEQRGQLAEVIAEHMAARHTLRESFRGDKGDHEARRKKMADVIRADRFDADALRADVDGKHQEHEAMRAQMEGHMTELAVAVHGILTPTQRAKLAAEIESGKLPPFLGKKGHKGHRGQKGHRGHKRGQ